MHLEEALNSKMDIKALIFDMDGLLFDSERIVQRSWEIAGNELGIYLSYTWNEPHRSE